MKSILSEYKVCAVLFDDAENSYYDNMVRIKVTTALELKTQSNWGDLSNNTILIFSGIDVPFNKDNYLNVFDIESAYILSSYVHSFPYLQIKGCLSSCIKKQKTSINLMHKCECMIITYTLKKACINACHIMLTINKILE